jgi:hypothetical protein
MVHSTRNVRPLRNGGLSKFKLKKVRKPATQRPPTPEADKVITPPIVGGFINGWKASAPEVALATVLDKHSKQYMFRYQIPAVAGVYGLRGQHEVDFVVFDGILKPVQVDDETFVHKSPEQKAKDAESDIEVNKYFHETNPSSAPVVRIDAIYLVTKETANNKAMELGLV